MARKRDQVPEWQWDIGKRIQEVRKIKGYKNQEDFADALEDYRKEHFPDFKPFYRNDVEHIENGGVDLKAQHILAVQGVLGMSCDEILLGYKPEDQSLVDEFGFSPKALIALRNNDHAGEVLSFFMDNNLIELLYSLKQFFEMEPVDYTGTNTVEQIDKLDLARYRIAERLKTWRLTYLGSIRNRKNGGGEKNEQTGKRGRNSKKAEG